MKQYLYHYKYVFSKVLVSIIIYCSFHSFEIKNYDGLKAVHKYIVNFWHNYRTCYSKNDYLAMNFT